MSHTIDVETLIDEIKMLIYRIAATSHIPPSILYTINMKLEQIREAINQLEKEEEQLAMLQQSLETLKAVLTS